MTIAQRFVEMGEQMGIDTSNCKTGNIAEVLNALTQDKGGEVSDSQNIQLAMMNFNNATEDDSTIPDFNPSGHMHGDNPDDKTNTDSESGSSTNDPTDNTENTEPTEPTNSTEGSGW